MAKTVISAFDSPATATRFLDSALSRGFDTHLFSVINPRPYESAPLDSAMRGVPSIPARLYKKAFEKGASLLVARIPEHDVGRLIELLQAAGGSQIEAFDCLRVARAAH